MTLSAQMLKMRRAHKSHAAVVCAKLKVMSKLIVIDLYQIYEARFVISRNLEGTKQSSLTNEILLCSTVNIMG
jgi:hypothetical protein